LEREPGGEVSESPAYYKAGLSETGFVAALLY